MLRRLTYHLCFVLCILCISPLVSAQQLTEDDKYTIRRLAELRMKDYETLLQIISNPDIGRGAVDRYIMCSYTVNCNERVRIGQVFYNDEVVIEDDVTPIELNKESIEASAIDVSTYLNKFKLQYKKGYDETVSFSDLTVSEVRQRQDQSFYVVVDFISAFMGGHNIYKSYQYKPVRRSATLEARYDNEDFNWVVLISGVNFSRKMGDVDTTVSIRQDEEIDTSESVSPTTEATETSKAEDEAINKNESKDEINTREEAVNAQKPIEFTTSLPSVIKKGKSQDLQWNQPLDDAEVRLYKGETMLRTVGRGLEGEQWNWNVKQKPGKNYSLMLYDPSSGREARSDPFQVKPRFPLALKIAIPAAVVVGVVVWQFLDDTTNPVTTGPDNPGTDDIDWSPSLPGSGGN